jgi:hypothetical protein
MSDSIDIAEDVSFANAVRYAPSPRTALSGFLKNIVTRSLTAAG